MERCFYNFYDSVIKSYPILSSDDEKRLFSLYAKTGDSSIRNKIIYSNFRLVFKIAYLFSYFCDGCFKLEDMVSIGNIGLIKAFESFDYTKSFKFSTYAFKGIMDEILHSLNLKNVDLCNTYNFYRDAKIYHNKRNEFYCIYGTMPSYSVLSKLTGFSITKIKFIEANLDPMLSLDTPVVEDKSISLVENIADSFNLEEEYDRRELRRLLLSIIASLKIPDSKKQMYLLRYGFIDGKQRTVTFLAEKYGVSHQAVSLYIRKINDKIRDNYGDLLRSYVKSKSLN